MANKIQSRQSVVYEVTKEDIDEMILSALEIKLGESLPFVPNKVSVDYSDPGNGIYQIRVEFDDDLPQVMPLREARPEEPETPAP